MRWRLLGRACWSMRGLALFMVGPALGLVVLGASFGLTSGVLGLAALVTLFALTLCSLLVRAEYLRLSNAEPP